MSDLPVVEPPFGRGPDAHRREGQVAGVLLAAGQSSRYGERNKLVERVDGEPIVRRAARTLLDADADPIVVVLGHEPDRVRTVIEDLDGTRGSAHAGDRVRASDPAVVFVENTAYADGQSSSVAVGVRAIPEDVDAAVIALGDMPWVSSSSVDALVDAYRAGRGTVLAAAYEGERGNPVLWDAVHFDALARQSGDVGGRDLLLATPGAALVETGDPGVRQDVDRPGDVAVD